MRALAPGRGRGRPERPAMTGPPAGAPVDRGLAAPLPAPACPGDLFAELGVDGPPGAAGGGASGEAARDPAPVARGDRRGLAGARRARPRCAKIAAQQSNGPPARRPVPRPPSISRCTSSRFLAEARDDGTDDLFELLDALDAREWKHLDSGEPVTPGAREHWRDERDEASGSAARPANRPIQHGVEAVSPARALLVAEASRLAER